MIDSVIQMNGDLNEQHSTIEPKGYKYVCTRDRRMTWATALPCLGVLPFQ
jgi:hypothetical protein